MMHAGHEFDQLAGDYDRHRPDYPEALVLALCEHIEAGGNLDPRLVVDVGAGTCIATRLLRRYLGPSYRVIGVEPGEGMRRQAVESTDPDMGIQYLEATAEELPFEGGTLAGVIVAQAAQWFDRPRFYREACRVLAPDGTLAILQNNRNWRESPFLEAYESFLEENNPAYSRHYRAFDIEAELRIVAELDVSPPVAVGWDRPMTVAGFIGMARSSSRLQQVVDLLGEERAVAAVLELAAGFADTSGNIKVRYQSELYLARLKR
jgi:SAM-dependent methyltransferase